MRDLLYVTQYLNVYPSHRNTSILFNGFSGCIDEVTTDLGDLLLSQIGKRQPLSEDVVQQLSKHAIAFLLKRGHLTRATHEEELKRFCDHVEALNGVNHERKSQEGLLMIVPSYNCNLACTYCFQGTLRAGVMETQRILTEEQVDRLFEHGIGELFPGVSSKANISVVLYGGEPFLKGHAKVLRRIIQYTTKYQMKVSAITNGTQVHHMLELFGNEMGLVNKVQISLDGDKERHDSTRIGCKAEPTFDAIIANIHALISRRVRIGLRLNIDKSAAPSMLSLIKRLEAEGVIGNPLVKPYAWVVHNHFDQLDSNTLLSPVELADYMDLNRVEIETPVSRSERRLRHVFDAINGISLRRTSFCMKCGPNGYVYDPYDNIYGCYEEAGHEDKRAGYFDADGKLVLNDTYRAAVGRHVGKIEECQKCSVALTCGGGCPFVAAQHVGHLYAPDCDSHKECVAKAVQNLFRKATESQSDHDIDDGMDTLLPYA